MMRLMSAASLPVASRNIAIWIPSFIADENIISLQHVRVKGNDDDEKPCSDVDLWAVLWYNKLNKYGNGGMNVHFLIRAAALLAAGAAGWALAKRKNSKTEVQDDPHVVILSDEEAVIDAPAENHAQEPVAAVVDACFRRMDPLTLIGSTEASFILADGTKIKLHIAGEGGLHLHEGDVGMLTWQGDQLILFEKENGEMIGGMYYVPAGEEQRNE